MFEKRTKYTKEFLMRNCQYFELFGLFEQFSSLNVKDLIVDAAYEWRILDRKFNFENKNEKIV